MKKISEYWIYQVRILDKKGQNTGYNRSEYWMKKISEYWIYNRYNRSEYWKYNRSEYCK